MYSKIRMNDINKKVKKLFIIVLSFIIVLVFWVSIIPVQKDIKAQNCCSNGGNAFCGNTQGLCCYNHPYGGGCTFTCDECGGGCQAEKFCISPEWPEWPNKQNACVHWGDLCGNAVRRYTGPNTYPCCCWGYDPIPPDCDFTPPCKETPTEFATCCNTTVPTNIISNRISGTYIGSVSWTRGANGQKQDFYMGTNQTRVNNNCPNGVGGNTGCVIKKTGLAPTVQSVNIDVALSAHTVYYVRVVIRKNDGTCKLEANKTTVSSCAVSPASMSLQPQQVSLLQTPMQNSTVIQKTRYTRSNAQIDFNPAASVNDATYPYQTDVRSVGGGASSVVTSDVYIGGAVDCTDTSSILLATPTPTPGPWIKINSGSFYSKNGLLNRIPASPLTAYDADDTTNPYFIDNGTAGGNVAAPSIDLGAYNPSARPNSRNISVAYTPSFLNTSASYLSYVKARKEYKTITALSQITGDGLYVWNSADSDTVTINDTSKVRFDNRKVVLITSGTVTVNTASFAPTSGSTAIIAGTINFNASVTSATGIFIASTVSTGTTTNQGLKINGNLVAQTTLTNNRKWATVARPSLFIVFKPLLYLDLLPYLGTNYYEWNQTQ